MLVWSVNRFETSWVQYEVPWNYLNEGGEELPDFTVSLSISPCPRSFLLIISIPWQESDQDSDFDD